MKQNRIKNLFLHTNLLHGLCLFFHVWTVLQVVYHTCYLSQIVPYLIIYKANNILISLQISVSYTHSMSLPHSTNGKIAIEGVIPPLPGLSSMGGMGGTPPHRTLVPPPWRRFLIII